jgi:hypothetical protein
MFAILAHGTFTDDDTFTIVTAYYNELVDLIEQEGIVLFESCSIHDYR